MGRWIDNFTIFMLSSAKSLVDGLDGKSVRYVDEPGYDDAVASL